MMDISEIYLTAEILREDVKSEWKKEIASAIGVDSDAFDDIPLEKLVIALYSCYDNSLDIRDKRVIAYGAGKMAQKYIPVMCGYTHFVEIWDAYSSIDKISEVKVVRPLEGCADTKSPVVIFIDDKAVRYSVAELLKTNGYSEIYYFRDYMNIIDSYSVLDGINCSAANAKSVVERLYREYELIDSPEYPVFLTVLKSSLKDIPLAVNKEKFDAKIIYEKLNEILILDKISYDACIEAIECFIKHQSDNVFSFAYSLEIFMRKLLSKKIKTKERPIKMVDDVPYDQFAIYHTLTELLALLIDNPQQILELITQITELSEPTIPVTGAKCCFALKCEKYDYALETIRETVKKEPNSLLADEILYNVVIECRKHGIDADEPVAEYDLNEKFCWSGLNFVWCGGFDSETENAIFSPCFRTLQSAARPDGEFWCSDEWKEFRKSVTDGSFRYCQKLQCPNIVAGWLPRKKDCKEEWLQKILNGDYDTIPPIEEFHFSYDNHCNLICPSCRTERKINTKEESEKLDELYRKNLSAYLKQAKHLTLSGCGEAMISPHSKNVLKSFSPSENPNLVVELRTNTTAINSDTWMSLGEGRKVIRHITASIDAADKESFEKLRYPAKWETVLNNLEFIKQLRNNGEIDMFEFHVVVQTENVSHLCDIVKMAISYDADAVTFSRLINWRGMPEDEYSAVNPFWPDHPMHKELLDEIERLKELRKQISEGKTASRKNMFINIHFIPDPDTGYDEIRTGKYKIR